LAKGGVFKPLQDPAHLARIQVDEFGHSVSWRDDDGYEIDLSADGLRRDCERQAEINSALSDRGKKQ
jgi:hypothetical protein